MTRATRFLFICTLLSTAAQAQETPLAFPSKNEGAFFIFQLAYNRGLGKIRPTHTVSTQNYGYMVSARGVAGYFLEPELSIGILIGLDGYHKPDYNLFPLEASFRYYLVPDKETLFFNMNVGYAIKLSNSFKSGTAGDISVGYRINSGNQVNLLIGASLNFQRIENADLFVYNTATQNLEYVQDSLWLATLGFNVGFLF